MQVYAVAHDRVGSYPHVREEAVLPVALYGFRYLIARHGYLLPHAESGDAGEHVVLIAVHTADIECADMEHAHR